MTMAMAMAKAMAMAMSKAMAKTVWDKVSEKPFPLRGMQINEGRVVLYFYTMPLVADASIGMRLIVNSLLC